MVQKLGRAVLALVNRHRINDTELVDRLSVLHKRSFVVTREATIAARQDVGPVTFQGPATVYGLAFGSTCGGPRFEAVAVGLGFVEACGKRGKEHCEYVVLGKSDTT